MIGGKLFTNNIGWYKQKKRALWSPGEDLSNGILLMFQILQDCHLIGVEVVVGVVDEKAN